MKARKLVGTRISFSDTDFADLVLWVLPKRVDGSKHHFKYRLAYVVNDECVLRYDNERGKGDHKHVGGKELPYAFTTVDRLMADFYSDIERWNDENGNS